MAYIIGPFQDHKGEPTRTVGRWIFLEAMRQEFPGILPDLWAECIKPACALLETRGPKDRPENLFTLAGCREGAKRREAAIFQEPGVDELRMRHFRRAEARAELWETLTQWGNVWRLTDDEGNRNRWLLDVALRTLLKWCLTYPDTPAGAPPDTLDWRYPSAGHGALTRPARQFRARRHTLPPSDSPLGPLSRDLRWLVLYGCSHRPVTKFADGVREATVKQQVDAAARLIGFEYEARTGR